LPDEDFAGKIWETTWGQSNGSRKENAIPESLILDGFQGDQDCEYWGDQERDHWLGTFEFCKRRFAAKASYGGEKLEVKGHLVHYIYRRQTEKEAGGSSEEDTLRQEP
jgi:hypothetical protein